MKKKIGTLKYQNKEKTLWACPVENGDILIYFKEYDVKGVKYHPDYFTDVGWYLKYKPSYRFQSSYTVWFKGDKEECERFLEEVAMSHFAYIERISLDEVSALAILNCLSDEDDRDRQYKRKIRYSYGYKAGRL